MTKEEFKAHKKFILTDFKIKEINLKRNEYICECYPFLRHRDVNDDLIFDGPPEYTLIEHFEEGWKKKFAVEMCEEIKQALLNWYDGALEEYRVTDIKEKWAYLHWYDNGHNDIIKNIIHKYEEKTYKTCVDCGKRATRYTQGWIRPYCDKCFNKINNKKL